jgi:hypothetical protein
MYNAVVFSHKMNKIIPFYAKIYIYSEYLQIIVRLSTYKPSDRIEEIMKLYL